MFGVFAFLVFTLSVLGWMLYVNSKDRKRLERDLAEEFDYRADRL